MPKMLTKEEIIDLIEEHFRTRIWNVCMLGDKGPIEGTNYEEIFVGVLHKKNVESLKIIFEDILNVNDIKHTGIPKPARSE